MNMTLLFAITCGSLFIIMITLVITIILIFKNKHLFETDSRKYSSHKKNNNSELKFKDFQYEFNSFIKITWNGKVIYDDEVGDETPSNTKRISEEYGEKIVYSMNVLVDQFHHTILEIEGE